MIFSDAQLLALVSAVLPFLVALASYLFHALLARLPKNRQAQLTTLAQDAVHAAEQLGSGQSGQVKKQIASDIAMKLAANFGVKVNQALVSGLIEAAVYAMNKGQPTKQSTPPPVFVPDLTTQNG